MLIDLPNTADGSSTGFGFFNNGDGTYTGVSVFYDGATSLSTPDFTWLCDSVQNDTLSMAGYCFNFQPINSVLGGQAQYRFTTKDLINVNGWTNISGVFSVFNVGTNIQLLGAFELSN